MFALWKVVLKVPIVYLSIVMFGMTYLKFGKLISRFISWSYFSTSIRVPWPWKCSPNIKYRYPSCHNHACAKRKCVKCFRLQRVKMLLYKFPPETDNILNTFFKCFIRFEIISNGVLVYFSYFMLMSWFLRFCIPNFINVLWATFIKRG